MNKIPNRQAICDVLLQAAQKDKDIVVLCSDSRGSASLSPFAQAFPKQFIEMGIAEQSLVCTAAGLAHCGKKAFAASPACFLSTRSMEQVKVDVAYSGTNVTLIGISGGISYGALGMTHHSAQDIAALGSIPEMRVYLPSDRFQTTKLIQALLQDTAPAYVRVGRNPVSDLYSETMEFALNKSMRLTEGTDLLLVACGEMVAPALAATKLLEAQGVSVELLDMYCVKPLDEAAVLEGAKKCRVVLTIEEHSKIGGLGALVSQLVGEHCPRLVYNMALPDTPVISGKSEEVFAYYGLTAAGICERAQLLL